MIDQLAAEGFVIIQNELDTPLIEKVSQQIVKLITNRANADDQEVIASVKRNPGANYLDFRDLGSVAFELIFSAECQKIIYTVLGSEVSLSPIQHVRAKLPTNEAEKIICDNDPDVVPWHQDAFAEDDQPNCFDMLTLWVPLCDVGKSNGGLKVIPGSHVLCPLNMTQTISDLTAKYLSAVPGDVVVFHKHLVHGSDTNDSNGVRYSLDFRIQTGNATRGRANIPSIPYNALKYSTSELFGRWCYQQDLVKKISQAQR